MQWVEWIPTDWIPAISTSTILAVISFVLGTIYKAKVEKGIQHKLDKRLEELRSKFRKEEELLKADLRRRDEQIAALRSGALSGLTARNTELDKKRIAAIENIWSSVIDMAPIKAFAKASRSLKFDKMLAIAAQDNGDGRKMRQFAETFGAAFGVPEFKYSNDADKYRIFVTPIAWALYSAYRHVISYPGAQLIGVRTGVGHEVFADPTPILDLVKTALPHQSQFIGDHGVSSLAFLIDELEERLFFELVASLNSSTGDKESVKLAADILRASDRAAASMEQKDAVPDLGAL